MLDERVNDSITNLDTLSVQEKKKGVNLGYIAFYVFTITLGMFQFGKLPTNNILGYCIEGFNSLPNITYYRWGWTPAVIDASFFKSNYQSILTTVTNLGAMCAALGAGPLVSKISLIIIDSLR